MVYHHKKIEPVVVTEERDVYPSPPDANGSPVETLYPVFGVVEDLLLGVLRPHFEKIGVKVYTEHSKDIETPLILVRSSRAGGTSGFYPDDPRFLRSYKVSLSVITSGVDAETQGAMLIEAAHHVLMMAKRNQVVIPGHGNIAHIREWIDPVRVSDFQTATNIVQYPSLPRGHVRYEQNFNILVRPDISVNRNPFVANEYQSKE